MTEDKACREAAFELYQPPFRFESGYIFDAKGRMVSDDGGVDATARVRGWGHIAYLPNPERLQDEIGAMVAEALTEFWSRAAKPAVPEVLFDGYAVLQALSEKAKARTSPENVADVLDAAVKLIRAAAPTPPETAKEPT